MSNALPPFSAKLLSSRPLGGGMRELCLEVPDEFCRASRPGMFVHLKVPDAPQHLLRRDVRADAEQVLGHGRSFLGRRFEAGASTLLGKAAGFAGLSSAVSFPACFPFGYRVCRKIVLAVQYTRY